LIPTVWPANTWLRLIFCRLKQMRPQDVTVAALSWIVALPIAAALPVAAPALAAEQPSDYAAMLTRAEQIVDKPT
jgi:hypothetical protein